MKTIHKYQMHGGPGDTPCIEMHKHAQILGGDMQHNVPTFWALVDTDMPVIQRQFLVIGTGWAVPENGTLVHIDTMLDGVFVWHLFEFLPDQ